MARTAALPIMTAEGGLTRYLEEIRRFPMLEPQEEYMLAKRWREHGDRDAAHKLVTSHLRLVAKIAMGYRGYGLPISEVISEGNVGLMQAVKRFEPEKGFRLATYAMWWIKASIQEYILRSWSLVKMGTTANQKKLFFNLRKAKSKISALQEGDLRPDQVQIIAKRLGVTEQDVVDMNRRLGGDASLNAPIREDGESGEWQDWLADDSESQETVMAAHEELDNRRKALSSALDVLNERERRIFEARRLADDPITLEELAEEFGVSRERVRQIEVRAFEKVQKAVKNKVAAMETPSAQPRPRSPRTDAQAIRHAKRRRKAARPNWRIHGHGHSTMTIFKCRTAGARCEDDHDSHLVPAAQLRQLPGVLEGDVQLGQHPGSPLHAAGAAGQHPAPLFEIESANAHLQSPRFVFEGEPCESAAIRTATPAPSPTTCWASSIGPTRTAWRS